MRRSPLLTAVVLFGALLGASTPIYAHGTHKAAIDSGYNSRIIDDSVFSNSSTMSASDIQNFLNSKVPACQSGYTCLKDYIDPTTSLPASQLIYNIAQDYTINPQVILVTLQKEQSLVTDDFPFESQYRSAMGYGCPESESVCNSEYYGFYNQLNLGTKLLRVGLDRNCGNNSSYPGWTIDARWRAGNTTDVDFKNTYIGTCATGSLYNYTPHRPDSAYESVADGNHYYGNYNFITLFNDWFGSTYSNETNVTNTTWLFENIEGTANPPYNQLNANTGQQPTSIVFGGDLHIFHYDATGGNLRHAYHDTSWNFETLDGTGGGGGKLDADVGKTPVVISDGTTALHLFYYDATNGDLRHAWSDSTGGNWTFETLDGAGGGNRRSADKVGLNPSASTYANTIQLFYYDITHGNLRHAWLNGSGWNFENLDGDPGSIAGLNSNLGDDPVVLNYTQGSSLQLFYYDISNGNLRHGWNNASGWHFENLDGTPNSLSGSSNADTGRWTAATVYNGHLQMFYYDITHGNLRHAWTSSKGWHFENLDGDPGAVFGRNYNSGITPSIVVQNNVLYLFYYDQDRGDLRHGYSDASGWKKSSLDGDYSSVSKYFSNLGIDPTVTVYDGYLQLFYYDSTGGNLRHAWGLAP